MTVVGHTSSEGSDAYNQELSQRRAESVAAALAARGIDAVSLSAKGAGENQPIADNTTEAGRSLNRRVEIVCR
jgi:OmpA-OmpF porin, OOP family